MILFAYNQITIENVSIKAFYEVNKTVIITEMEKKLYQRKNTDRKRSIRFERDEIT